MRTLIRMLAICVQKSLAIACFLLFVGYSTLAVAQDASDIQYVYDDLGRLHKVKYIKSGKQYTYLYDKAGNRKKVTIGGISNAPLVTVQPGTGIEGEYIRLIVNLSYPVPQGGASVRWTVLDQAAAASYHTDTSVALATEVLDYKYPQTGVLSFPEGARGAEIRLLALADDVSPEPAEKFYVHLSEPNLVQIDELAPVGIATITNVIRKDKGDPGDIPEGTFNVWNRTVTETDDGTLVMPVTIWFNGGANEVTYFSYRSVDGSAKAGSDYVEVSGEHWMQPGEYRHDFDVTINGDTTWEPDETFTIRVDDVPGSKVTSKTPGTFTILNNDDCPDGSCPVFSLSGATASEGEPLRFALKRISGDPTKDYFFKYYTSDGLAKSGFDYTGSGSASNTTRFTFTAGASDTRYIEISTIADTDAGEGEESMALNVEGFSGIQLQNGSVSGKITNVTAPTTVAFSVNDTGVTEGGDLVFTVTKAWGGQGDYSVAYATRSGSGASVDDYTAKNGTLSFSGTEEATQTVRVPTKDEDIWNQAKTVELVLSSPSNGATLTRAVGKGSIENNDGEPIINVWNRTVEETDSGTLRMPVDIWLRGGTTQEVYVTYRTVDGTAKAGEDYQATSGTIPINGYQGTIYVNILGDETIEGDETFQVVVDSTVYARTDAETPGTITIQNDDVTPLPLVNVWDDTISEPDSGSVAVTVTIWVPDGLTTAGSVHYQTVDGTAKAGEDYVATSGTVAVTPGTNRYDINVEFIGDTKVEGDETFQVVIDQVSGVHTDSSTPGTITIQNNDVRREVVSWGAWGGGSCQYDQGRSSPDGHHYYGVKTETRTGSCVWSDTGASCGAKTETRQTDCGLEEWTFTNWSDYGSCQGDGLQYSTRTRYCKWGNGESCETITERRAQTCITYTWNIGSWGAWQGACGGTQTKSRPVTCVSSAGSTVSDSYCSGTKPTTTENRVCYKYTWHTSAWSAASSCSGGQQTWTRTKKCIRTPDGADVTGNANCGSGPATSEVRSCRTQNWSRSCGSWSGSCGSTQYRTCTDTCTWSTGGSCGSNSFTQSQYQACPNGSWVPVERYYNCMAKRPGYRWWEKWYVCSTSHCTGSAPSGSSGPKRDSACD